MTLDNCRACGLPVADTDGWVQWMDHLFHNACANALIQAGGDLSQADVVLQRQQQLKKYRISHKEWMRKAANKALAKERGPM